MIQPLLDSSLRESLECKGVFSEPHDSTGGLSFCHLPDSFSPLNATVEEDKVKEHLKKLDVQKSTEPDGLHLCMLSELADANFGYLWIVGDDAADLKEAILLYY